MRMDWALAMPSPIRADRLQQRFYLFVEPVVCSQESDENSRRMWLRTRVVHPLVRRENVFFSTGGMKLTNAPKA